jgi:hypothetical protein
VQISPWMGALLIGFTTTSAISAYHHWCCEFESRSERGVQHYVIKFVSDLRQVGGFFQGPPVTSTNKAERSKSKDWLARNQYNVSEWSDMSIHGLLLQWASTIKIQLSVLVARTVVAVFVWQLDLQLPLQSVLITTDDMSLNLDQSEVYNIRW